MSYPAINLGKGKEFSLQRKHPWVFSGAIARKDPEIKEGDLVEVFSNKNDYLGTGFYASGSIAVRIISFEHETINAEFWQHKISKAWLYRQHLGILNEHTNVCRLFFGEGDGVPGLILDYYDGHVVLQVHSGGVYGYKQEITEAIKAVLG
ncbi:MAG: class I SAM-dependent rRNA methyltransferase, partial [Sphingobacteriia bacterium]|nr:class I SAM-dependent rRNA methyltransferase [Sphingobacteriia bacterium]